MFFYYILDTKKVKCPNLNKSSKIVHTIVDFRSQICHNTVKDLISKEGIIMLRDPISNEIDSVDEEQLEIQAPVDSRIVASNAIKYTAYVMLLFGFLYFLIAYLAPMLEQ